MECVVKYIFLLILLPIFLFPVFAESQQLPTDKGTLLVDISTEPAKPTTDSLTKLKIDFINPTTKKVQEHVDYIVTVTKDGDTVFGPIPLTHTSTGSVTIPVEFKENGEHKIAIGVEGIVFQPIPTETVTFTEMVGQASVQPSSVDNTGSKTGGGCLIATAAFGTEMAPQVQLLREVRDSVVFSTGSGMIFMNAFNDVYYSFSPTVADWERQSPIFKEVVKTAVAPMLSTLSILNRVDIGSEQEMLGYGIVVILLNVGMYFVAPAIILSKVFDLKNKRQMVNRNHDHDKD